MANTEVQRCLDWLLEQKTDLEESSFGHSKHSVTDASKRHLQNKSKVKEFRTTINDVALTHNLSPEEAHELHLAYTAVQSLVDKKSGCFEVISGIAALEDQILGLTSEFDTRAVHLVNMSANNQHKASQGLSNESMARTTQNCITAVRQTWKWLDELMQCAHVHLSNASAYHQFFHDVEEVEYWMTSTMSTMHGSFRRGQLQGDSADLKHINMEMQDTLQAYLRWQSKVDNLLRRSADIVPVPRRTTPITDPCPVMALSGYKTSQIDFSEGESLTLLDNSDRTTWKVKNSRGQESSVPAAILLINGPSGEAVDAAVRLRIQLLGLWTASIKRLGFQMIAFMQHVFKDWSPEQIKAIQQMPEKERHELSRILDKVENGLRLTWQEYEGFEELQENMSRLSTILEEANGHEGSQAPTKSEQEQTAEVIVQIKMLEDLLNTYQSFWAYWEHYKVGIELFRQPKYLLVCDRWDQLKYTTTAHFVRFWDTNLLFPKGGKVYKAEAALTFHETPRSQMQVKGDEVTVTIDTKHVNGISSGDDVASVGVEETISSETTEQTHAALPDMTAQMDEEDESFSTEILQTRRRQELTTDEVVSSTTEVKHTFIIRSVTDPRNQEELSLKDAIIAGIIDQTAGLYINPDTGKSVSFQEAMAQGDITVQFKTQRKIREEKSSYGIITVKTSKETRPYTIVGAIDPETEQELSLDDAYKRGVLSKEKGTYKTETGKEIDVMDAIQSGLVKAEFHGDETHNGEEETKSYAVNGVIDQRHHKKVSFSDALRLGLLKGEEGIYVNNLTWEEVPITEAIMRGFIKARVVTDTSKLDIDPTNQIVVQRIAKTRQKILSAIKTANAFKRAGHS